MNLVLTRPIVFFDLETTGTSIMRDRIVEISIIKVMPDGSEIERTLRVNRVCQFRPKLPPYTTLLTPMWPMLLPSA